MNNDNVEDASAENNTTETQDNPAPVTPAPADQNQKPKGAHRVIMVAVALALVVVSGLGGYMARGSTVNTQRTQLAALHTQVTDLQKTTYVLPASAVKVSDCIPDMGFHYIGKDSDKEYGPFYLVNKSKQVIGIEYMAASDMYTNIPGTPVPLAILEKPSPAFGMKFDHVEFDHLPKGHEGLEEDHIDVHMYTVSADTVKNACN